MSVVSPASAEKMAGKHVCDKQREQKSKLSSCLLHTPGMQGGYQSVAQLLLSSAIVFFLLFTAMLNLACSQKAQIGPKLISKIIVVLPYCMILSEYPKSYHNHWYNCGTLCF